MADPATIDGMGTLEIGVKPGTEISEEKLSHGQQPIDEVESLLDSPKTQNTGMNIIEESPDKLKTA